MTRFHFERPDGNPTDAQNILIHLNEFVPPQGFGGGPPPVEQNPLLALYPPLGDTDYSRYKFYQVNKGEFAEAQTDFIWEITGSVGPGVLQQASGFDIRPFLKDERDLTQARDTGQSFGPPAFISTIQLSDDQLHLFIWTAAVIQEWILSAPHVFPPNGTDPDFTFDTGEGGGKDIKFIKNGTEMAIVGTVNNTIEIYSLSTPNSFSNIPILLQSFDVSFLTSTPTSCEFSRDGMQLYVMSRITDEVNQWNLTSPFTLPAPSTTPDRIFDHNPTVTTSNGNMRLLKDGASFYMMSDTPNQISKYIITDGVNQIPIINKSPDAFFDVTSIDGDPTSISLSLDNSLLWFAGVEEMDAFELFLPGLLLEYEVVSVNVTTGDFVIKVKVPSIEDFTFIQIAFGNAAATDDSTTLGAGTALSTFETPLLTKDEDNFLVDDQGRNIVAVQT